jgi:DinB superfamily
MISGRNSFLGENMKETPRQYIQRITSHAVGQDPLKVQAATPKKLQRLLSRATPSKLRKRPAPDKWCIAEIVAHLADTEIAGGWRMRLILGAPGCAVSAFDQDAWVTALHYDKRDSRKALEQFRVLREANLAMLKTLTPEQWKHSGVHAERGVETIEHMARMFAGHDLNHIAQIEQILATKK